MDSDLNDLDLYGILGIQQSATEKEVGQFLTTYVLLLIFTISIRLKQHIERKLYNGIQIKIPIIPKQLNCSCSYLKY